MHTSTGAHDQPEEFLSPLSNIFSESDDDDDIVCQVQVRDQGNKLQVAKVQVQGVFALGHSDTGANITIMGGELFKKMTAAAWLKKKNFKGADTSPHIYMGQRFKLDGP